MKICKYKNIFFLLLLPHFSLFICNPCYSGESGSVGAVFLKIPVGARPVGMGEAYGALADDANAIYYNPAGITNAKSFEGTFMHDARWCGMRHEYMAFVAPIGKGGIGLSISYFSSGEIEGMDENGLPTQDFLAYDYSLAFSYARKLWKELCAGGSLKYIAEKIENEAGSSLGFDFGLLMDTRVRGLRTGISLQNIGKGIKLVRNSYPLPLNLKLCSSYKLPMSPVNFCVDLNIPNDDIVNLCLGLEYQLREIFALRLGYKTSSDAGAIGGFRFGCGFKWDKFCLDYGLTPYGILGNSHKISIGFKL